MPLAHTRSRRRRTRKSLPQLERLEIRTLLSAIIQVIGNGNQITSGSTTPSATDFTDFGYQSVNGTFGTVTRTFTISNTGDAALVLTGQPTVQIAGTNANDFTLITDPSGTILPGTQTTFTISFVPHNEVLDQETVVINSNDPTNSAFTFAIQGTGLNTTNSTDGLLTATVTSGSGQNAANGMYMAVSYTGMLTDGTVFDSTANDGGSPLQFQLGAGQVIPGWEEGLQGAQAGETRVLMIPPSLTSGTNGTLSVPSNVPLIYSVTVQSVSTSADSPTILVLGNSNDITSGSTTPSADTYTDFGYQSTTSSDLIGTITRTYTIMNTGIGSLTLSGSSFVQISGANANDFSVITQPQASIGSGATASFTIAFVPVDVGVLQATVTIDSNDPNTPAFTFAIDGTGLTTTNGTDGLMTSTIVNGTGQAAVTGSYLSVSYVGQLIDGTIFDSTAKEGGSPFSLVLGQNSVITGWEEGLVGMKAGESRILIIPASLAYGSSGSGSVPSNAPLIFKVDASDVQVPTIAVSGNGVNIPFGDTTTSTSNGTYLGTTLAGSHTTLTSTFIITNANSASLSFPTSPAITITGNDTVNFSASSYSIDTVNGYATFTVTFTPSTGDGTAQSATVNIFTTDPVHPDFTFDVAATYTPVNKPVLNITGNGVTLTKNDTTPSDSDFTNFDTAPLIYNASIGRVSRTYTITNLGDATLNLTGSPKLITVSGANPSDFQIGVNPQSSLGGDQQTSFTVVFTPKGTGVRRATITVLTNDPANPKFTFTVQGTAVKTTNNTANFLEVATTVKGTDSIIVNTTNQSYIYADFTGWLTTGAIWGSTLALNSQFTGSGPLILEVTNGKIDGTMLQQDTTGQLVSSGTLPVGMTDALQGILAGETRFMAIPSDLGFGASDNGSIPANSTLLMTVTAQPRRIVVYANQTLISYGETTPSTSNLTQMGTIIAGSTVNSITQVYQLQAGGNDTSTLALTSFNIPITGSGASAFTSTSIDLSNATYGASFTVTFHPHAPGTYTAIVHVKTNDPVHPDYQFTISATETPWVDLTGTVGTINFPASGSLTSGAPTNFTVPLTITNHGNAVVSSTTSASDYKIYLHPTNSTGNASDILISTGTTTALRGLGAGKSRTLNLSTPIPIGVSAGSYTTVVTFNSNGAISEFDATNNSAASARVISVTQGFYDLTASIGTTSFAANASIISGASTLYKIPVTITNLGNVPIASNANPVSLNVYIVNGTNSTQVLSTTTTALRNLAAGKSFSTTLSTSIPIAISAAAGDQFVVKVDENGGVADSNLTNNNATTSQTFAVTTQGFYDLAASMGTTNFAANTPTISGASTLYKIPVTITNLSNLPIAANASAVSLSVYLVNGTNSTAIYTTTTTALRNLAVGKSYSTTLSTAIPIAIAAGANDQFVVKVDENGGITDSSLANNNATTSQTFAITQGSYDLAASMGTTNFAANATIISGASTLYKVPVTITNVGNLPITSNANPVSLKLYLVNGTNSTPIYSTTTTALRNLAVGKSYSTTLSTTIPIAAASGAGDQFVFKVDENGGITDSNLANNNATTSQTFAVTQGFYNVNGTLGASTYPVSIAAGATLTGKLTTIVASVGNLALPANQKFTLKTIAYNTNTSTSTLIGVTTLTLSSWAPNHSAAFSMSATLLAGLTSGSYQLESVLTPVQALAESNTADNTITANALGGNIRLTVT